MPVSDPLVFTPPDLPTTWDEVILPIDKPKGWSSFDVIRRLRRMLRVKKVGHAGTLDPMATGLLICMVGRATKQANRFMEMPKAYQGVLRLGETTPSYDAETPVLEKHPWEHLTREEIEAARDQFIGDILQLTPMYSAVKVKGERLYKKARRGEKVPRPPRQVTVSTFEIEEQQGADVSFRVECSKGTYIRSLAHDLGQVLGVGAHLVALRRTAIGPLSVEQAWQLPQLESQLRESHEA